MKIIVDDQYNNDDNKEYTIDKDGNVNLFINIGDEIQESDTINVNNNINSNNAKEEIDNNFSEVDEDFGDAFIIENVSDNSSTISKENPWEDDNYAKNYQNIYAEIENSLQKKYAEKEQINEEIYSEGKAESFSEEKYTEEKAESFNGDVYTKRNDESFNEDVYTQKESEPFNENFYTQRKVEPRIENIYTERKAEPFNDTMYNERNDSIYDERYNVKTVEEKGVIDVYSKLGSKEGIELRGARINIYLLNGVTPKLYDSKFTDSNGKLSFDNLPNGCYRVIAIVDRRYFEKPIYYNWNEVIIDRNNKHSSIVVVNKIKPGYYRR